MQETRTEEWKINREKNQQIIEMEKRETVKINT